MKLKVSRWLHDGFAPAKRPRKIILSNAKRQAFFVGSTAIRGHCNVPVQLCSNEKFSLQCSLFFLRCCSLSVMKRARFSLYEFFLIGFLVKKLKCQSIKGKASLGFLGKEGQEKMRNPIGKRYLVVSFILSVYCVQYSYKLFSFFSG